MPIAELNVLVIEDDDFQRRILANTLRSVGVAATLEASNGKEGLEIIRNNDIMTIHVALCDLNMPEMDGMEFLRHLSEKHQHIAAILTSSLDSKLLSSVGRMAQMYGIRLLGVLEKPVLMVNLKETLSKYDSLPGNMQPLSAKNFTLPEIFQGIQDNQFEPFFQPKVDMKSGRLVGAESLARWVHPEHGIICPHAFIPLLEQAASIDDLTFLILKKSADACSSLHAQGHLLTISVNLSLVSLEDTSLADRIIRTVQQCGIDPQYIVLEITESAAMTNVAPALENLARLCIGGFALSIDDYGTGSSNLQQLTRIAFNELKIDQSFVRDCSENKAMQIVVESSIDMARKLFVKSVAEGVETQQDWDALKIMGCDTAQGYFIAKPMDIKAFDNFVIHYKQQASTLLGSSVASPSNEQRSNIKVLVVEDNNFARTIIVRVLADLGFSNIAEADSAMSAIKLMQNQAFDLVVTDVNMPVMNGLKFIQMVRAGKTHAKPETRIVVLTHFSQTEIVGAALALDVNGFLVKPIIPAIVEEKLMQAMSERIHLHSPLAYEMVNTELTSIPALDVSPAEPQGLAVKKPSTRRQSKTSITNSLSLYRLRPGMVLQENVYLKDGTLVLSAGQTLSELSINRLNDLKVLLPSTYIAV